MNIKQKVKDNKKIFIVGGVIVTAAVAVVLTRKIIIKNNFLIDRNLADIAVAWKKNPDKNINLEKVKAILDLNAESTEKFAIFRDGNIILKV